MAAGVMAVQPKLRATTSALVERAPVRWIVPALVVAAVIGTAAYSYREIDRELTAVALMRRETVAQLSATILAGKFDRLSDIAVSLATRVRFREMVAAGKWAEAIQIMHAVPRELPLAERLILTDTGGTLKADLPAIPGARGIDLSSHEWFQGVRRDGRPYISSAYTRVVAPRRNIFSVAVPVRNAHANVVGYLVLQIGVETLLKWVETVDLGPHGFLYIVDPRGQVAFHSRRPEADAAAGQPAAPIVEKLRRAERGVEIASDPAKGEDFIIAYAAVPGYGWGVVTQQPTRVSLGLAARDHQLRQLLTGYGLILALGIATMFLTSQMAVARRQAEEERRMKAELERQVVERTAELQAANRELEAFSYSVSHDLRAPLRSIDGFSQAVLEDYAGKLDDQGRDYLSRVRTATQHMGHLIDDLIKLARVARTEMHRESVDLSALAGDVFAELQKSEPDRRVECHIESGLATVGDARLLRVVLDNLLGNAWKFTGKQAHARIVFGTHPQESGEPAFFVRDNGAGFDMTYAGKLFGAFQRLHSLSEFPGTGVGLATVQRIVHRHGGRVWAEGAVGKGATFYFTL
jgi:signal transduction histidine kinase